MVFNGLNFFLSLIEIFDDGFVTNFRKFYSVGGWLASCNRSLMIHENPRPACRGRDNAGEKVKSGILKLQIDDNLPGVKIIGAEVEVPDMKWIGEVIDLVISFGS
jgi:hypothetical protein